MKKNFVFILVLLTISCFTATLEAQTINDVFEGMSFGQFDGRPETPPGRTGGKLTASHWISEQQGNVVYNEFLTNNDFVLFYENLDEGSVASSYLDDETKDFNQKDMSSFIRFKDYCPKIFKTKTFFIAEEEISQETIDLLKEYKILYAQNVKLNIVRPRLNQKIEETYGFVDAIPECRNTKVIMTSISTLNVEWDYPFKCSTLKWNGGRYVPSVKGNAKVAFSYGPEGEKITHIKMGDFITISIVPIEELKDGKIGEWITEDIFNVSFETKNIEIPKFKISNEIDFSKEENYKIFFAPETMFNFLKNKKINSLYWSQKNVVNLNEAGIKAQSINVFVGGEKGIFQEKDADIVFDKPFVMVVSIKNEIVNKPMRIYWVKVINP